MENENPQENPQENPVKASIRHSIEKNGFPEKNVQLPFKPVFESCKRNGVALNDVLAQLKEDTIFGTITGDYIVFRPTEDIPKPPEPKINVPPGTENMPSAGTEEFQKMAQEAMGKMTPEQMEEVKETVQNMSDEEKKQLFDMYTQMFNPASKK